MARSLLYLEAAQLGDQEENLMKTAADIMESHVICVSPEASLMDVHRVFIEEEIHGAPVVDETKAVVGVISSADLVRALSDERAADESESRYLEQLLEVSRFEWEQVQPDSRGRLAGLRVEDVMTKSIAWVSPDAGIGAVAHRMREDRVHRVLVIDDTALVGIISSFDLVALLED
jgi:CBS domain-containing protein